MGNANSHLILFSSSYPFGNGEQFLESEINFLAKEFNAITIIPYNYGENKNARTVPSNVIVNSPLKPKGFSPIKLLLKGVCNFTPVNLFIKELTAKKFFHFDIKHLTLWFRYTLIVRMLAADKYLQNLINNPQNNTVVYFYWGKIHSAIIPFIDKSIPCVVKFHGGDLYEERTENSGYIPFRRIVLRHLHTAIFISDNGKEYLNNKYPDIPFQTKTYRLGVQYRGVSKYSDDNNLRIVSCSALKKLKRVHILVEAFQYLDIPIIWTHIGTGSEEEIINNIIKYLPSNIKVNLTGHIPNDLVYDFYLKNPVDLFVNTSEYEGVPVSIMEALSFSIPVFAPMIGGIPELIDSKVGRLLPANITPIQLSEYIKEYYYSPIEVKLRKRDNAFDRWNKFANAEINYADFSKFLKSLAD